MSSIVIQWWDLGFSLQPPLVFCHHTPSTPQGKVWRQMPCFLYKNIKNRHKTPHVSLYILHAKYWKPTAKFSEPSLTHRGLTKDTSVEILESILYLTIQGALLLWHWKEDILRLLYESLGVEPTCSFDSMFSWVLLSKHSTGHVPECEKVTLSFALTGKSNSEPCPLPSPSIPKRNKLNTHTHIKKTWLRLEDWTQSQWRI